MFFVPVTCLMHSTWIHHVMTGEKLPWTAKLENLTVYTVHHSDHRLYLLKPTSLCATLAVTTKYRCLQTDNLTDSLSLLGLCIHADMQTIEMAVSNPQVRHHHLFTFGILNWSGNLCWFLSAVCVVIQDVFTVNHNRLHCIYLCNFLLCLLQLEVLVCI